MYSAISAFLLVYYTNVIGASAAAAASIIAISKFLDGISDLAMGYIVDHTHSKWGKARPWIARLCIPLAVCTVLMFSVPSAFAGKVQIAYMFLTYNLVSTIFYTGINVPYATMQGLMTMNQYERGLLGNFRNFVKSVCFCAEKTVVRCQTRFLHIMHIFPNKWRLLPSYRSSGALRRAGFSERFPSPANDESHTLRCGSPSLSFSFKRRLLFTSSGD